MAHSPEALLRILRSTRTIAVVGLSNKPDRPSYEVASYLKDAGYRIIPVNPTVTEVLGERAYPGLRDVSEPVDVVLIFRRPSEVPAVVDDAVAVGAKAVWMQPGAENEEAAARARAAGLEAVVGACMMTVHRALARA
ncbi:MAG: CoA-binding protein [Armatimonadota bacterium]|nr:CoA-binding protein [Armatimonadota bacterium]